MRLSEKQRIEVLMMIGFGNRIRTYEEVREAFNGMYPARPPISLSTISRIYNKFMETGNVRDQPKVGRPSVSEDVQLDAVLTAQESPHVSVRQLAADLNIGKTTVCKVFRRVKYHPYKVHLVHELNEDDFDRRMQFCEIMMEICNANPHFVRWVLFSDEATFQLNGIVNRQNCRYWTERNPHWMMEMHTQHPQSLNVWAGIIADRVVGPYFFEGTLTGARYLEFLQDILIPSLAVLFPNQDDVDLPNNILWYQQDGAPPHFAVPVRDYLNQIFPGRWIGRRGSIEWPARSPDLTPLDFFLWGYIKSKIYKTKPNNIDDLKARIRHEFRLITPATIANVQQEFIFRLGHCQAVNGAQFEHLI